RHRLRPLRPPMRRLYGRGRCRAAEAERLPHEALGSRGPPRFLRLPGPPGARTLKDALNEALRDWVANVEDPFYCIGTVAGPHPYPTMVRDFQSVIGIECIDQMPAMLAAQGITGEAEGRQTDG